MIRWRRRLALSLGLVLACALLALSAPLWLSQLWVQPALPQLELPSSGSCLAPADWMRTQHMELLKEWRTLVVREGLRSWTGPDGRVWTPSLNQSCLACHSNQARFCDACHNSFAVRPRCWSCHTGQTGGLL